MANIEINTPITEELVRSELLALVPVFKKIREQLQTGRGALGKIDSALEDSQDEDPNEILALLVLERYKEKLQIEKDKEIASFYHGNSDEYDEMLKALTNPIRYTVLLGYYSIKPDTDWRFAIDVICSRQRYKDEGFPKTDILAMVLDSTK